MTYKNFLKCLKPFDADVYFNFDLKKINSFKIGGKAKYFVVVKNTKTLLKIISKCKKFFILGGGTNTLFANKKFNGTIIKLGGNFKKIYANKNSITASAGVNLSTLCHVASNYSFGGIEFLFGIPGTVGGAIFGNAGAFEDEILNHVESVKVLNNGKIFWTKTFFYSHRFSSFKKEKTIILAARFSVKKSPSQEIISTMKNYLKRRKETQPIGELCAGSIFKRNYSNSKLIIPAKIIDNLGLKGVTIGGAKISEKHAGFIVNTGQASYRDVLKLIKKIKKLVYKKKQIKLEEEIIILGGNQFEFVRRFPHPLYFQPWKRHHFRKRKNRTKKRAL